MMKSLCSLLLLSVLLVVNQVESRRCSGGFSYFSGHCYKFVRIAKSWSAAENYCTRHGGHLVSIGSRSEHQFIFRLFKWSGYKTWIGLSDHLREGRYQWADGSPYGYMNWGRGEPNNLGNEDCVEMGYASGKYNDMHCSTGRHFICERTY